MSYTLTLQCGCVVYVSQNPATRIVHTRILQSKGPSCVNRRHEVGLRLYLWELLPPPSTPPCGEPQGDGPSREPTGGARPGEPSATPRGDDDSLRRLREKLGLRRSPIVGNTRDSTSSADEELVSTLGNLIHGRVIGNFLLEVITLIDPHLRCLPLFLCLPHGVLRPCPADVPGLVTQHRQPVPPGRQTRVEDFNRL